MGLDTAPLRMTQDRPQVDTVNTSYHYCRASTPIRNYPPSPESVATRVNARVGLFTFGDRNRKRKLGHYFVTIKVSDINSRKAKRETP